jgi:hypothetical protein
MQYKDGKEILSEAEDKSIVSIPPVRRIGIVAVERELIAIRVQVENVRVAIPVYNCIAHHLCHCL